MFSKVLVANRAEIAVRGFRAAHELGARTVAVFPHEDRYSEHRLKADEAYRIGEEGHPVRAYLDVDEIIRVALESGADAIYPGYGFLAENPALAQACAEQGIAFIGPPAEVLKLTGNKTRAIQVARDAGIPVPASTEPSNDPKLLMEKAPSIGFPLFVKAVAGGGGRGMRRVERAEDLADALNVAMKEAENAFGDATAYLEQAVSRPRHIEVQVLADSTGQTVHLFERDCSLQRRHQKVIEIAPAPNLDPEIRAALTRDAVKFAKSIGYVNAGTVEFLVETAGPRAGQHVFIEMNPRIQVEHTVTEEVTNIDLVSAQMRIAAGETLSDIGIAQDEIEVSGTAIQCRITTEDPANEFRPDTGRITVYRSPGGAGVRLDGATAHAGAEITGHFDSMLVKLTCRGRSFEVAATRALRALAEFRIRGIRTNILFLKEVLTDERFMAGDLSTSFIDERPELLHIKPGQNRGTRLLRYIADVSVNKPYGERPDLDRPFTRLPGVDIEMEAPAGTRQQLLDLGPEAFAQALRAEKRVRVTDTTFRDAHQSLLATRVRTYDLLQVAPVVARTLPQLFSAEVWGGATYDVSLRFLGEDPWERLARVREAMPNIALQMLLRGRNTVGYTPYPTEVTDAFVQEATATGIDIFRIFDALNDVTQMVPAINAVRETGTAVAEVALCYTGNLLDPAEELYTLDYYLRLADQIVSAGAHVLAIKDMAGLLRAPAAARLVSALRERFDLPVHLHTHDTAGGQLATLLAAIDAGVDAVDTATSSMAGTTSQPSMSALVAALEHTEKDTGLDLAAVAAMEPYWESVRKVFAPFESGLPGPTGRVYEHEIPGGQLSNLRQQAIALGLGDKFEQIEAMYAAANRILGNLVKVTPSSKVVGDLALHLVAAGADPDEFADNPREFDIPDSVISFLQGQLGTPPGGWPEPFRTRALAGREPRPVEVEALEASDLERLQGASDVRRRALNELLFPAPTREYESVVEEFGDISVLSSLEYLYGLRPGQEAEVELQKGVRLIVGMTTFGEVDSHGMRTVICQLNGQQRTVEVRDRSVEAVAKAAEKADPQRPGQIAAPFAGTVTPTIEVGQQVAAGDTVAMIEAMKMEAAITSPIAGVVERLAVAPVQQVEGGDLVLVINA
ncbi:MAG TPA: pyruvate carboxylase, partial [Actinomycetales bacterium]|nr:pyruvate carboxylase [Actinomycetales bacterium]